MRGFASSASRAASKPSQSLNPKPLSSSSSSGHISQIIKRKDWFLILNQSHRTTTIPNNPRFIISLLQNQENPLHSLRLYLWVSNLYSKDDHQSLKTVLGNVLFRKGPLLLSKDLLKEVRDSGFSISDELMCVLIGSWGRLGLAKYCNDVFAEISLLGMKPSTRLYNAVIDALVKSNSLDLAYLKFHQMRGDGCEPDRFTYNILAHGVCKKGVVDEGVRLVKQMEREGMKGNVFTFTILIDGFLRAGRVEEALEMFERRSGNEATVRTLVRGVFRCLPKREAFEVLVGFVERESSLRLRRVGYDTVLSCLSSNSMGKETALFLRKIGGGYVPDSSTFNAAMSCVLKGCDDDDLVETCGLFDGFVSRGVKPGFDGYLAVVQALLNARRFSEGDCYLKRMCVEGIVSSVYDYNAVIDCLCKARRTDRAAMYLTEMKGRGISPSLVTFNTLLSGYSAKGDVNKVRQVVEKLLEHGCKPDVITFSSIINCLCRAKETKDAFECFKEMLEWGVEPNEITYNILIRSSCSLGDTGRSVKLFAEVKEKGLSPDVYAYNAVIQGFCRMRKVKKGEELFKTMLRVGLKPDNYTYSTLIRALSECGRESEAREMFSLMERHGCAPDSYTKRLVEELDLRMSGLSRETVSAS
ncbi:Putative pentatricopeptide repeat-containing protein [Raphanus sativus]|uniref:Pentatricopeptide repeat-containing protein At3g16890, mitochondrial n=1 Tax=Raphanus sativus TaxID=3726 RepID=A0A6J0P3Z8_RAPSA|nr:putative pentatricopeptide repeat-containing protein At3g16890, mitochondrial [Raphanus sativus]KAJ4897042.1 Putative pentatricopeptide repeat-containing protein [Raphanus sativus]